MQEETLGLRNPKFKLPSGCSSGFGDPIVSNLAWFGSKGLATAAAVFMENVVGLDGLHSLFGPFSKGEIAQELTLRYNLNEAWCVSGQTWKIFDSTNKQNQTTSGSYLTARKERAFVENVFSLT